MMGDPFAAGSQYAPLTEDQVRGMLLVDIKVCGHIFTSMSTIHVPRRARCFQQCQHQS
jgi:hypothetical protein